MLTTTCSIDSGDAPRIDVWYGARQRFGARGRPIRWINVLGNVSAAYGLHDVRWVLNDDPREMPAALGPGAYRLHAAGDFNIEFDADRLAPGDNRLTIRAIDTRGAVAETGIVLEWVEAGDEALPRTIDWSDYDRLDEVGQVLDGVWRLEGPRLRCPVMAYDRCFAIGDLHWRDYEVLTDFVVHAYNDDPLARILPSMGSMVALLLRGQGNVDWHDLVPYRGYYPYGMLVEHIHNPELPDNPVYQLVGTGDVTLASVRDVPPVVTERTYGIRARVYTDDNDVSWYQAKFWPLDADEPKAWMLESAGVEGSLTRGSVVLIAHQADVSFGPTSITPL